MEQESKNTSNSSVQACQNCKVEFTIEPDDFDFYAKIKVPPPTFCPECRMIRRMVWRNERSLFKRECAKTGKQVITMFHPKSPVVVYDRDVWWSDEWDPTSFGQDYDFSKPFFVQFKELLGKVPLASLGNTNVVNSLYGNHNADCKDCYLTYASWKNERVSYSQGVIDVKDSFDLYTVEKSEKCYNDLLCSGLYRTHFSYNSDESLNSFFIYHCINLQDCIGCINLRSKRYCIFNEQYQKDQYIEESKKYDFGSYKNLIEFEKKYNKFSLDFPRKHANFIKSFNVTGDNGLNSKNAKYCFDSYGEVEDSKFVAHVVGLKDGYDGYGFGAGSALMYEGVDSGIKASKQYFAVLTHSCMNTNYTYMCYNSKNLFGCIGIRKGDYYILNKKYSREDYEKLVPKIIEHMNNMPFIDSRGHIYKYGEFFPSDFSPFSYNETIAQEYFPKTKENIASENYLYREHIERGYKITIPSESLPDHINDANKSIINETISCPNKGSELSQCTEAFRITLEEFSFLKNHNIALPRYCPNCRHFKRLSIRNPLKLWHRKCMCDKENHNHEGKCEVEFETSYSPDRPEIIYCEKCYQQEVI